MEARAKGRACATVDLCVGVGGLAWRELSGKFDLKPFPIDNWDNFSLGRNQAIACKRLLTLGFLD